MLPELPPSVAPPREVLRLYDGLSGKALLEKALHGPVRGQVALVSSFGADSAVLLHMVSRLDPGTPVLFLETGFHFAETLDYRDRLVEALGLRDVRSITPRAADLSAQDPTDTLHQTNAPACCDLRKTQPLERALAPFAGWINGRRRGQGGRRTSIAPVEVDKAGRLKLNPLANWTAAEVRAYRADHALPAHPRVASGYRSIGCAPCTTAVRADEDDRAGRWRGTAQVECGIHITPYGVRRPGTGPGAPLPLAKIERQGDRA